MANTLELYNIPFQCMYIVVHTVVPRNGANRGRVTSLFNDSFYLRIEITAWIREGSYGFSYVLFYYIFG